ncbi:methyltransferase [Amycolatopsis sp. cg5]|uniref:methyltransferase n=1 Tax=Amycolatopsis sp. cg5 TaxID=3238802 RepID=UPI0035240F18
MTEPHQDKSSSATASMRMMNLLSGFQVSQALYVVAELNVATALVNGPRPLTELAAVTGADADALRRIVRFLATIGVFDVTEELIALTTLGRTLAEGVPGSMRDTARYFMEALYPAFTALPHTAKTGEIAADHYYGMPFFDWVNTSEHLVDVQNRAMANGAGARDDSFYDDYALPPGAVTVDVGGADGTMLVRLLANHPGRRGIVFDRPDVVAGAEATLARSGVADRIQAVGGDFFDSVPAGDVHVLSVVLHNWDDRSATHILDNVSRATTPGARLVVIEMVLPEDNTSFYATSIDMVMLAMLSGRERTESEWRALLDRSGFTLDRIVPSHTPYSFIEATRR